MGYGGELLSCNVKGHCFCHKMLPLVRYTNRKIAVLKRPRKKELKQQCLGIPTSQLWYGFPRNSYSTNLKKFFFFQKDNRYHILIIIGKTNKVNIHPSTNVWTATTADRLSQVETHIYLLQNPYNKLCNESHHYQHV